MKRREYRIVWWCPNVFSGGGEYVPDEDVFTSKAAAMKRAALSAIDYRTKIQWRNRGTCDSWKFLGGTVHAPAWALKHLQKMAMAPRETPANPLRLSRDPSAG